MKNKIFRGLLILSSSMLVLSIGVGNLLENNASMVDDALGTVSSKVITDTDADLYPFKIDEKYNTTDKFFNEMKELATTMQTEGSVLLKNNITDGKAALPLKSSAKITLLGAYSHAPAYGGNMHGLKPSTCNIRRFSC